MEILIRIFQIVVAVAGCIAAVVSMPLFVSFRWPAAAMWGLKLFVSALSPVLFLVGVLTTLVGLLTGSVFLTFIGLVVVLVYAIHMISVTRPPHATTGFEQAFGPNWEKSISLKQKASFLSSRMTFRLPAVPDPQLEQNICFATVPGASRPLLCDVWQPPEGVIHSGLAFIYLHGSAFYILDKDFCTRPFFRHLAAQGHVIMDVAHRLAPETDITGMVQDVKRAIVWMKEQASRFDINPDRIVVGGGSAGAHLALLTAYANSHQAFIPEDLARKDSSVCAVVSVYGTSDLTALYYHTNQHLTTRSVPESPKKKVPTKMPQWMKKAIGKDYHRLGFDRGFENVGTLPPLLGGHPDECPERYAQLSPITHVHRDCPPTLLIHGAHDIMAPVSSTRRLYRLLKENHVPAVLHVLSQSDHGFDLVLPKIAPATHNAIYDVERFLALMAVRAGSLEKKPIESSNSIATAN